jgi:hypothetical protein
MPALRALIEHPTFEFVGVRVSSDAKAGRDAGELCGVGSTGIHATTSGHRADRRRDLGDRRDRRQRLCRKRYP